MMQQEVCLKPPKRIRFNRHWQRHPWKSRSSKKIGDWFPGVPGMVCRAPGKAITLQRVPEWYGKDDFKKITPEKGFNTGNDSIFLVAVDSIGEQASLYEYYAVPADIYGNAGPASDAVSAGSVVLQLCASGSCVESTVS